MLYCMLQALTKHAVKPAVKSIQPRTSLAHFQSHAGQGDRGGTCYSIVCLLFSPLGLKGGTLGAGAACSNTGQVIVITQPSCAPDRICFKAQITRVP